jgi:hypothetical protein
VSESEAYHIAIGYLRQIGVTYHRCYSKGFESDYEVSPGSLESDFPRGRRRKVWSFAFALMETPPDVIVSGTAKGQQRGTAKGQQRGHS